MSKKIGLYIGGRRFDVDVDDEFANFLEVQMEKDFNIEGNNEIKSVMQAYVRKNYELYIQNKDVKSILDKFEK
ncbi:MAG: hypothetical protein SPLUMA2_SPLUMAMAG2_00800 [uncultured Sulfurimonas sp.]|nr:MAG: hypothetical protein SPLUMA1_SPLUMAMAG1_00925 [uncultured Sulfurimonas sp.]CAI6159020.1 MAG: hypothetical protein SPLUMA2_SPLUMAMAG2_00800 [uncultured Sulfurimonas sp.]